MTKRRLVAILLVALAACSAPANPRISARDGWSRATGGAGTAAAYVTIANKGGADQLIGVRTNIGRATLHESAIEDGVVRMRPLGPKQGMSVPSNGKLLLAPGGAHVMITGLRKPLEVGDRFALTLLFDRSRPHQVTITVKPATASRAEH